MKQYLKMRYLLLAVVVLFCLVQPLSAQEVRVSGGATILDNYINPISEAFFKASGIKIIATTATPGQGWKELNSGKIDAAIYGLSFSEVTAFAEKEIGKLDNRTEMLPQVVAMMDAGTKIIANKNVGVTALAPDQLAGIFSGTITNWSQLGGPDVPIVVVTGSKIPAIMDQFKRTIMQGKDYTPNAVAEAGYQEIKDKIIATPGAIGFSTAVFLDDTIQPIRFSGGMRIITLITKGVPSPEVEKLVGFIQKEGKKYFKQ